MTVERITVEVNERGIATVQRRMRELGMEAQRTGPSIRGVAQALGLVSGALVARQVIQSTVNTWRDFGQTMATVRAVSSATEEQFTLLKERAQELGSTTRFTASQAGDAMLQLARAGFTTQENYVATEQALRLAQAGALDLGTAARITANVLRAYRGDVSELAKVTDVLAKATNSSMTDVQQLGHALRFVAPVARGLNVPIETTVAALGALSDAGLASAMAGTGLRRVISALERPTTAQNKILKELGINQEEVKITSVGLVGALRTLRRAGMDTGQALALFGMRGGPAAEVLVQTLMNVEELEEKLQDASGTAKAMAGVMDDTLNGAMFRLRSAIEAVQLKFGDLGGDTWLTQLVNESATLVRQIAGNLLPIVRTLGMVLAVTLYQRGLLLVTRGLAALRIAIMTNPIGAMATVAAAAAVALSVFSDKIFLGSEAAGSLNDAVSAVSDAIKASFVGALFAANEELEETEHRANSLGNTVGNIIGTVALTIAQVLDKFVGLFTGLVYGIWETLKRIPKLIANAAVSAYREWTSFTNKLKERWNDIASVVGAPLMPIINVPEMPDSIEGVWREAGGSWADAFKQGWGGSVSEDFITDILDRTERKALERLHRRPEVDEPSGERFTGDDLDIEPRIQDVVSAYDEYLARLRREGELLRMNNQQRELGEAMDQAKAAIGGMTPEQELALQTEIRRNQALADRRMLLDEIHGPQEDALRMIAALNHMMAEEVPPISLQEYEKKLKELKAALGGMTETQLMMREFGQSAFREMSRSLDEFVDTGTFKFREFASNVIRELVRITQQKLLLKLATSVGLPGFASGGSFMVGGSGGVDSQLVAFKATPGERVDIATPAQQSHGASGGETVAAPAQVRVVNVTDPNDISEALSSPQGEQIILNTISRNPGVLRQVLS